MTSVQNRRKKLGNLEAFGISTFLCGMALFAFYLAKAKSFYAQHKSEYIGDSFIQEDRTIGYSQRPNIEMQHVTPPIYTVYTDNLGGRASHKGVVVPSSVDILGIGCSFAWGHGVDDQSTYLKLLGRDLHLTVFNAALASYGMTSALLSLEKHLSLKPKVVIYGFIDDHIARSLHPCAPCATPFCRPTAYVSFDVAGKPYIHPPGISCPGYFSYLHDVFMEHPFGFGDVVWAMRRDLMIFLGQNAASINARFNTTAQDIQKKAVEFLLDRMVVRCRQIGAKLVIVYLPDAGSMTPPPVPLAQALAKYSRAPDVFFTDASYAYRSWAGKYGESALKASVSDSHPSEQAHFLGLLLPEWVISPDFMAS